MATASIVIPKSDKIALTFSYFTCCDLYSQCRVYCPLLMFFITAGSLEQFSENLPKKK